MGESLDNTDLELQVAQVLISMGTANTEKRTLFASPERMDRDN